MDSNLTSQKEFLVWMVSKQRAEIVFRNQNFSEKGNLYYRLKRLIDENQMGALFKVMLIKNKNNKFRLGY